MGATSPLQAVLTAPEAAKRYRLSRRYLVYLLSHGLIKGRKAEGTWLIEAASLKRFLATPRHPGPKPKHPKKPL